MVLLDFLYMTSYYCSVVNTYPGSKPFWHIKRLVTWVTLNLTFQDTTELKKTGRFALLDLALGINELDNGLACSESVQWSERFYVFCAKRCGIDPWPPAPRRAAVLTTMGRGRCHALQEFNLYTLSRPPNITVCSGNIFSLQKTWNRNRSLCFFPSFQIQTARFENNIVVTSGSPDKPSRVFRSYCSLDRQADATFDGINIAK